MDLEDPETAQQPPSGNPKVDQQDPERVPQTTEEKPTKDDPQTDTAATVHLLQAVKVPARHAKLVRARTGGLSFPKSGTVVFQPGGKLRELTGPIVEDAIIPAEEEVTLMISNPGMSPIRLQEGLADTG